MKRRVKAIIGKTDDSVGTDACRREGVTGGFCPGCGVLNLLTSWKDCDSKTALGALMTTLRDRWNDEPWNVSLNHLGRLQAIERGEEDPVEVCRRGLREAAAAGLIGKAEAEGLITVWGEEITSIDVKRVISQRTRGGESVQHGSRRQDEAGSASDAGRGGGPGVKYDALDRDLAEVRRTSTPEERAEAFRQLTARAQRQERAREAEREGGQLSTVSGVAGAPVDAGVQPVSGELSDSGGHHDSCLIVTLSDYADHDALSTESDMRAIKKTTPGRVAALGDEEHLLMRIARLRRLMPRLAQSDVDDLEGFLGQKGYASLLSAPSPS